MNIRDLQPGSYRVVPKEELEYEEEKKNKRKKDLLESSADIANTLFPGKQIGESLVKAGTNAYNLATGGVDKLMKNVSDNRTDVPALIGDYAQAGLSVGSAFVPTSKAVSAGQAYSRARGAATVPNLVDKSTALIKNVGKGAGVGYGLDVTQNLKEGKKDASTLMPGAGTIAGGALPPALGALGKTAGLVGRGISEASGAVTGQNYGGQRALMDAIETGGNKAVVARAAMRNGFTPEQIVDEASSALNTILGRRSGSYQKALGELKGNTQSYDISPILRKLSDELDGFKVDVTPEGLDFSRSPIRFNKEAQQDISQIYETMRDYGTKPGDRTVAELDSLKRAFGDLYSKSGEARKFVTGMTNEVRNVLKEVPGYSKMSDDYSKATEVINDIRKGLSLNDRAAADTAYKKFAQILRNDTDARMQLLKELDDASDGKLIPMVAGELSKTWLPRGLSRLAGGLAAGGAGISQGSIGAVFQALILAGMGTSPRLAGEIINILGVSKRYTKPVAQALNQMILRFEATKGIERAINTPQE